MRWDCRQKGLSKNRIERRWRGIWRHRFVLGRGMCSDDTEHTFFVAQALLEHPDDPVAFQRCLAWKLQLWLLGLPAGIGLATLRAILKLWVGFSPSRSGVYSAGNGPAMRSAILGAYFCDDAIRRRRFVSAATRITHTDPKAETAALAVAEAAAWAMVQDKPLGDWVRELPQPGQDDEWLSICRNLEQSLAKGESVTGFAESLGLKKGVSGYSYHSVPVALYAWARHPDDFRQALESALNCGGDTDTVGAIVGALSGASGGPECIPAEWLQGIWEWPRTMSLLKRAAGALAGQKAAGGVSGPAKYFWLALVLRNLVFAVTVVAQGFARLIR